MTNGTDEQAVSATTVPFADLPRRAHHRMSGPTKAEIKATVGELSAASGWEAPLVDAVILACTRIGRRDLSALAVEVASIMGERFPAPHVEPGS